MENVTEAGSALAMDCYYEEYGVITEQAMKELLDGLTEKCDESLDEIDIFGDVAVNIARDEIKRLAEAHLYQTAVESARKFSVAADFAAKSAKTSIAAWRDGKWVPTGGRSSRRKMGVGGKRW